MGFTNHLIKAIRNGAKLDPFNGKTLFSKTAHNDVVRVLNAILNFRVVRTGLNGENKADISEQNLILSISNDGGTSSSTINRYRFKSMQTDYIVCRTWDGASEGGKDIFIAKRPKLRFSISSEVISGVLVTYSSYSATNQSRSATDGTIVELQIITPTYLLNDEIYSLPCQSGVSVSGVPLTEMDSDDSRAWAAY